VTVDSDDIGRYPREIESAVYFSVLEAMQNVAKYAQASHVAVRLRPENGSLTFSVTDDGRGFHKATTPYGMGLQNMSDRLAALGGSFDVRTAPGEGTTVLGRVPADVGNPGGPREIS
jgi:signal transduction histidine kinase